MNPQFPISEDAVCNFASLHFWFSSLEPVEIRRGEVTQPVDEHVPD